MISSLFSISINIKSRVPVLLLVILNGASKSYTISWLLVIGDMDVMSLVTYVLDDMS